MMTRREFLLSGLAGIGGWSISGQIARQIRALARQHNRALLVNVTQPTEILYAVPDSDGYSLSLGQPYDECAYPSFTWREWFKRKSIDFNNPREIEDYFVQQGDYDPDSGELFVPPSLDAEVTEGTLENYLEWDYARHDSPLAKAYEYLDRLPLSNLQRVGRRPLGDLWFEDGATPGSNVCRVAASNLETLSGLQQRLLELGEAVEIRVT